MQFVVAALAQGLHFEVESLLLHQLQLKQSGALSMTDSKDDDASFKKNI